MSTTLSEIWAAEYLHSDGQWYAGAGGPDEASARRACNVMWERGQRGVRLVVSRRTVVQEKTR